MLSHSLKKRLLPSSCPPVLLSACFNAANSTDCREIWYFGYCVNMFRALIFVCFFYIFKNWDLDFPCIFTLCQFIPSAVQVGTPAEVRENASLYFSFLIASDLCRSDRSPRMFAPHTCRSIQLNEYRENVKKYYVKSVPTITTIPYVSSGRLPFEGTINNMAFQPFLIGFTFFLSCTCMSA